VLGQVRSSKTTTVIFVVFCFIFSCLLFNLYSWANAQDDYDCKNIALVYLRGSGQNPEDLYINNPFSEQTFGQVERESYAFFSDFKQHLDRDYPHVDYKAVTVHHFTDKYDSIGYRASSIWPQMDNMANAEFSAVPGDYQESVKHGISETVGYVKDQIYECPHQLIALGGYSQGAQVVGESLFQLTEQERSMIVGVGLFGDPKYVGATGDSLINPFDKSVSYPWRRGDATNKDNGMLEPRVPYVPDDLAKRTASYCSHVDPICAGWTGWTGFLTDGHKHYAGDVTNSTVNEIMQWASPLLTQIEREKGGAILSDDESVLGTQPDQKARDVMFLVNDDSNLSVIQALRYNLDPALNPIAWIHPDTLYGLKAMQEADSVAHFDNVQQLTQYVGYNAADPMFSVSNLQNLINKRYPFGQTHYGSGDYPNPLGMAVEKAAFSTDWRNDTTRHLILFTDRPLKESYTYNYCNGVIEQRSSTQASVNCTLTANSDTWQKANHPEVCKTVFLAITQDTCTNPSQSVGTTQTITRTLDDEIAVAQTQKVAVDVVIPFNIRSRFLDQPSHDAAIHNLEYLAKATGGKFMYYDKYNQYNPTLFTDTLYQIFGHTPKPLVLAYKDALDLQQEFDKGSVLGASTNHPIILDASQSNQSFDNYKWDFNSDGVWDEISPGPVVEHQFTSPASGFVRFAGVYTSNTIQSETRIAVAITQAEPTPTITTPTVPDITESTAQNGDITFSWDAGGEGVLIVIDPDSHLPIAQVSLNAGSFTFTPGQSYDELQVRVMTDDATSDPQTITVTPAPQPVAVDGSSSPDPTLCYKLQQCQNESDPLATISPQLQPDPTIGSPEAITVATNGIPRKVTQATSAEPISQQTVLGATTNSSPTPTSSPIDDAIKEATPKHKNYHLQELGIGIFLFGGIILLYRIVKLR
jgi:hypothetical protein